jgi:hypothetical protein
MRPDMAQVIIERPRGGPRYKTPKGSRRRLQRGLDAGPRREGMMRAWGKGWSKWLSERLGPLRRFLLNRAGRPWNDVFAEICEHLRRDSAVQDHVRDHVWDFVARDVVLIDGVLCHGSGYWCGRPLWSGWSQAELYICPQTGVLRRVPCRPVRQPTRPAPKPVRLGPEYQCRWIRGAWHLITLRPFPRSLEEARRSTAVDVVLKKRLADLDLGRAQHEYGGLFYAVAVRQLSKAELRSLPVPWD